MRILCPTDLSHHSKIALEYAIHLANEFKAELHIITAFEVIKRTGSLIDLEETVRKNTEEDLSQLIAGVSPLVTSDIMPVTKVVNGQAVDAILNYAKVHDIDLVVMGTQGKNSLRKLLFGSVTRKMSQKSPIPVLAIPEQIAHKLTSNKLLLALDGKVIDKENIFDIPKTIANHLGLKIDIIHISEKEEEIPFDPFITAYLGDLIGEVIIKEGKDIVLEIKRYVEDHNVGMIIMIKRDKGFFKRLLTVGYSSEELARTNIPLMILPE
ncbi:MAG: universal stress protein [Bacteroidia bacterium]|nr:universal stress protein [Bacteroidia bacterium]